MGYDNQGDGRKMIVIILNWIGVILTIIGTIMISMKKPKVLLVNICYMIASSILIIVFCLLHNWAMIWMYIILWGIAVKGIYNHRSEVF